MPLSARCINPVVLESSKICLFESLALTYYCAFYYSQLICHLVVQSFKQARLLSLDMFYWAPHTWIGCNQRWHFAVVCCTERLPFLRYQSQGISTLQKTACCYILRRYEVNVCLKVTLSVCIWSVLATHYLLEHVRACRDMRSMCGCSAKQQGTQVSSAAMLILCKFYVNLPINAHFRPRRPAARIINTWTHLELK